MPGLTHSAFRRGVYHALVIVAGTASAADAQDANPPGPRYEIRSTALPRAGFVLTSTDVDDNGAFSARQEANAFGCAGANESPALAWRGAPAGTRSFAVTLLDLDAPTGSGFWHWIVYDIPSTATSLPSGAGRAEESAAGDGLPGGARQARTDVGTRGFAGACPPPGDGPHRYLITVHALGTDRLDAPPDASPALIGYLLHTHALGTASLTARYARPPRSRPRATVRPDGDRDRSARPRPHGAPPRWGRGTEGWRPVVCG